MRSDLVICTAIAGITIIEVVALSKGIDGTYLSMAIGALAFLFGLGVPSPLHRKKPKPPEVPNL